MSADTNTREVAYRVFATEYDDATLEYAESDEERAPKYVVTPTGARINRVFIVGVLTSVEQVNDGMVRARVVDPTGAFVVYAGQYQPDALTFLERTSPPTFLAVTGKANTFQPEDSDRILTSIRPESVNEVTADTRDRWVVTTAKQTLARIQAVTQGLTHTDDGADVTTALRDAGIEAALAEGVSLALDHYNTTPAYLSALQKTVTEALEVITGDRDEASALSVAPDEDDGTPVTALESLSAPASSAQPVGTSAVAPSDSEPVETAAATSASDGPMETDSIESGSDDDATGEVPALDEMAPETAPDEDSDGTAAVDLETDTDLETDFETDVEALSGDSDADLDAVSGDELYEFDDNEREQIKDEHGLEFSTGTDVESPDDASHSEPPSTSTDETADESATANTDSSSSSPGPDDAPAVDSTASSETEAASETVTTDEPEAVDLDTVLLDQMSALDNGNGADRARLIEAIRDQTGADRDAIESAIDDALMGGQCYEPSEGRLKPI